MHIGSILKQQLRRKGISGKVDAARMVGEIQSIIVENFPTDVSSRCRAAFIQGRYVTVDVTDPSVGQELALHQQEIFAKLAERFPNGEKFVFRWRVRGVR